MVQTGFQWIRPPEQAFSELTEAYVSAIHRGVLELNNAGRYAIIDPAIDHFAPILWSEVVRMLS